MTEATRHLWKRVRAPAPLSRELAQRIVGSPIAAVELCEGGLSNTHYRIELESGELRCLRIGEHGKQRAQLEVAVQESLPGAVPLPEILGSGTSAHSARDEDRPWTLYSWASGERLERVFPRLPGAARRELGRDIGRVLANIHARRFSETGILRPDLKVGQRFDPSSRGLAAFARSILSREVAQARLGRRLAEELLVALVARAGALDPVADDARLAHGDFGASNLLVDPERARVSAVLDWEFACAAPPYGDLGNLLRPPIGDDAEFCAALEVGYRGHDPSLAPNWRALARLSDLSAWLEFLSRPKLDPGVLRTARAQIATFVTTPD